MWGCRCAAGVHCGRLPASTWPAFQVGLRGSQLLIIGAFSGRQTSADRPCLAAPAALQLKQQRSRHGYGVQESLEELGRLADTAGLEVVGSTYQLLDEASWLGLVLGQLGGGYRHHALL